MRNWLAVGLVVGMVGSVAAGCSSSSSPMNVTTFCQQLAAAECPPVVALCLKLGETTCETAVEATCNANATASQKAGRTFVPGNVQACISAVQGAYAGLTQSAQTLQWTTLNGSSDTGAPASGSPNDLCQRVFQGTVATDGDCKSTYDCAGSNICGENGTCGQETDQTANGGCGNAGDLCTAGTVCTQQGRDFVCTQGAAVGASCSATTPCVASAQCKSGKCVALGGKGASCTSNADCDPTGSYPFCDPGYGYVCGSGYDFANADECTDFGKTLQAPGSGSGSSSKNESSSSGASSMHGSSSNSGAGSSTVGSSSSSAAGSSTLGSSSSSGSGLSTLGSSSTSSSGK